MILDGHLPDVPMTVDPHRAEIGAAEALEVGEQRDGLGFRLRHRVHEVEARALVREHVRDEDALGDLEPALVLLRQLALGVDLRAGREQARIALGGRVDELRHPQLPRQPFGQLVVKGRDVPAQMLVQLGVCLGCQLCHCSLA